MMFFLYPSVLFLFLPFILSVIWTWRKQNPTMPKHFSEEMLSKLSLHRTYVPRLKKSIFLLIISLFIVAIARPVKVLPYLNTVQSHPSLVIAIDVSKSMDNTDIYPSRRIFAFEKLRRMVDEATGLNIGILFYAKDAYMLYPLSQDTKALSSMLQDINVTQTFAPNSNLFAALEASNTLLNNHQNKYVLLLSDGGEEVSRKEELAYLKTQHMTLLAIQTSKQTNRALTQLCTDSGGLSVAYTWGKEDVQTLLRKIRNVPLHHESYQYDIPQYQEYFLYPLALGVLLLFVLLFPLSFRKSSTLPLLAIVLLLTDSSVLKADLLDFWWLHQAKKTSQNEAYDTAVMYYKKGAHTPQGYYNLATTLYRSKKYLGSITYYKKALGTQKQMNAKIYYNIATAYVRLNKLDFAKEYYERSLEIYPYIVTKDNLAVITQRLKLQRKNLHKNYEKLYFKDIVKNNYQQRRSTSNYAVKLQDFLPSQEELWFQNILNEKSPQYLQKISTTKRSKDANLSW